MDKYIEAFLNQNAKLNLISKNDEKFLWEKHIFDSLSIEKFFEKYGKGKTLLDIGTGGGFPSVPIALKYPEIEVYALDSIRKKINAIENIKKELNIQNLHPICDRAENIRTSILPLEGGFADGRSEASPDSEQIEHAVVKPLMRNSVSVEQIQDKGAVLHELASAKNSGKGFDIITSRAVASLDKITAYALPLLNKNGYFVAYKSVKVQEEIAQAKGVLKKYNAEVVDVIEYDLPLKENHTRNLVVIRYKSS